MKYGLPYKGSKNKLAERIVRLLPRRTNLVDLFCGGCAVSHAALLMGKFEHIYINDINWMCPTLFMDALQGKYANDTRWISREYFFRLRDTDPYVAMVWSFGNNMRDYLYSKEIEPLKKAIHYALFFSNYSLAKVLGHDLSFVDAIKDVQQRYRAVRQYFSQFGHFQQQSFEGGGQNQQFQQESFNRTIRLTTLQWGTFVCNQPKEWNGSTPKRQQTRSAFQKKKSKATLGGRTPRTNQQHCTDCNTKSGYTACPELCMGGGICPSHPQCLATSKWLYRQIALSIATFLIKALTYIMV